MTCMDGISLLGGVVGVGVGRHRHTLLLMRTILLAY